MAENKRIPELPYNGVILTGAKFVFYDEETDTTYHINSEDFLDSTVSPDSIYNPEMSYDEGAIVVYRQMPGQPYQVWISEEDDNLGNIPGPGSTFWTLDSPPATGKTIKKMGEFNPSTDPDGFVVLLAQIGSGIGGVIEEGNEFDTKDATGDFDLGAGPEQVNIGTTFRARKTGPAGVVADWKIY